ncbi:DHHA1 domain-containing protein [Clostridium sp. MB40-C1]|uniref:alanyl-tRNA editing protein n=1 Tax=Clostridium sp. MB40-C1 TaxID=3070996 RepID=UPI0027E027A8|nr:DHHA1 domain-containing protein [Clostridium sp. MB40-C1]WMJ80167.1 DHHA1 domain-containing protein [Clostridium sp. MB40-C1]
MEKLYYENQYIKTFTAEIINISEKNNEFHILLDKTYFYPGDGEQPCDTGHLESIPVIRVYEKEGDIYHVTQKKPIKIHKIKCSINWENRFDNMQQYLGQHILSSCFLNLFNGNTMDFKLDKEYCTINIDKIFDIFQIQEVEKLSNNIIFDNIPIEFMYPSKSELKKLAFKKPLTRTSEQIRIAKIGDLSITPCFGIHPKSTIEVQLIKIIKWENLKNSTRITFLCGKRAVADYFSKDVFTSKICTNLKCNEEEALDQIQHLTQDLRKIIYENSSLKAKIADYEIQDMINNCDKLNNINIIKSVYDNTDFKYINLLASKLTSFENVIVLFAIKDDAKARLIFMCSKDLKVISMNSLLKDAITLIDGNGGGSDSSAQGGGKNTNNLDSTLEYAFMKIKNCLNSK